MILSQVATPFQWGRRLGFPNGSSTTFCGTIKHRPPAPISTFPHITHSALLTQRVHGLDATLPEGTGSGMANTVATGTPLLDVGTALAVGSSSPVPSPDDRLRQFQVPPTGVWPPEHRTKTEGLQQPETRLLPPPHFPGLVLLSTA